MGFDDLITILILEFEKDKYNDAVSKLTENIKCFANMGNLKEMDIGYQNLRNCVKQHRNFIKELRNETNQ